MTWEDLAEEQEMLARARHTRAIGMVYSPLARAMSADAADAAGESKRFRDMHEDGVMLVPSLAMMLSIGP